MDVKTPTPIARRPVGSMMRTVCGPEWLTGNRRDDRTRATVGVTRHPSRGSNPRHIGRALVPSFADAQVIARIAAIGADPRLFGGTSHQPPSLSSTCLPLPEVSTP